MRQVGLFLIVTNRNVTSRSSSSNFESRSVVSSQDEVLLRHVGVWCVKPRLVIEKVVLRFGVWASFGM